MTTDRLNLSRRPFVNKRPVTRAAVLLWSLGLLLLLTNVLSFWSYLESSREKRAEVRAHEGGIAAQRAAIAHREEQVALLGLARQNDEVSYLNGKIAQRTFSWSQLLDRVAEVLPNDVRLQRLAPHGLADDREERQVRRLARRGTEPDRVVLQVDGQAKSDEALLELVDNLFADPAFVEPNLTRESHENGLIRFNLSVGYLPNAVVAGPVRPPKRHWKLTPEPSAPSIQAGPLAAPGAAAPFRPGFPPAARPVPGSAPTQGFRPVPGTVNPAPGAFAGDARSLPRRIMRPADPLRGIGSPVRPRTTPPPQEGGRR